VAADATDPSLQQGLDRLAPAGVLIAHRLIAPADENALLPDEAASIPALSERRRASGAARIVARQLMQRLGYSAAAIPRDASGMPLWPAGLVGSLGHDETVAVAALARAQDAAGIGIDVEPALPLPAEMRDLVLTPRERENLPDPLVARIVFAAKEAVYKAAYPLDRAFLEFADIEVDLGAGRAVTRTGRTLSIRHCVASHIVVLAFA
jgi:4'-phosphopantetheinyl transferase EntD